MAIYLVFLSDIYCIINLIKHVLDVPKEKDGAMKKLAFFILALSVVALTACNTVAGVGKDVSKAGSALSNAADRTGGTN